MMLREKKQSIFDEAALKDWLWQEHESRDEDAAACRILRCVVRGFREFSVVREESVEEAVWGVIQQGLEKSPHVTEKIRNELASRFSLFGCFEPESKVESGAGDTTKRVLILNDAERIECVTMRHNIEAGAVSKPRTTVCVSCQVGCAMKCSFCATGTLGLKRNLNRTEIIEQFAIATLTERLAKRQVPTNIVFMGQGETLDNYKEVTGAIDALIRFWDLRRKAITVSTVGLVDNMRKLSREYPDINQALSLHAPNQKIRELIVPTAKNFHYDDLLAAVRDHLANLSKSSGSAGSAGMMIEYVLLKDINDKDEHADELASHFKGMSVLINLIPYNANITADIHNFEAPDLDRARRFGKRIMDQAGIRVRLRKEYGADVNAACGQLALQAGAAAASKIATKKTTDDIEDLLKPTFVRRKRTTHPHTHAAISRKEEHNLGSSGRLSAGLPSSQVSSSMSSRIAAAAGMLIFLATAASSFLYLLHH